jgi:cytochrome c oxidase subunit 3
MPNTTLAFPRPPERREPLIPSGVLATLLFVFTEVMLFAGLVSAHGIAKASIRGGIWPPPGQPRLPVELTAVNSVFLLLSGVALFMGGRSLVAKAPNAGRLLIAAVVLGGLFVGIQGFEWVGLVREGLTLTSSTHGSFFYLIIGMHAVHALVAIGLLGWSVGRHRQGHLKVSELQALQVFWYFVVGIWPVLYVQVYL